MALSTHAKAENDVNRARMKNDCLQLKYFGKLLFSRSLGVIHSK
ncbi:hypothetical protein EC915_1096 [Pseudomonas sp. LP_7_YM]|nr:hypothetical protein EC915_1096 [Pseudomonas sp. LP_7_YM]